MSGECYFCKNKAAITFTGATKPLCLCEEHIKNPVPIRAATEFYRELQPASFIELLGVVRACWTESSRMNRLEAEVERMKNVMGATQYEKLKKERAALINQINELGSTNSQLTNTIENLEVEIKTLRSLQELSNDLKKQINSSQGNVVVEVNGMKQQLDGLRQQLGRIETNIINLEKNQPEEQEETEDDDSEDARKH